MASQYHRTLSRRDTLRTHVSGCHSFPVSILFFFPSIFMNFASLWQIFCIIIIVNGLNGPGFKCQQGQESFLISKVSRPALLSIPPPFDQYCVSCLRVEQPGCEFNHSSLSIAEVKNGWSSTSTLPISPHFMDRDKLYLFYVIYGCNGNLMF